MEIDDAIVGIDDPIVESHVRIVKNDDPMVEIDDRIVRSHVCKVGFDEPSLKASIEP